MPELPEVETVRKTLEPLLSNKTIQKVDILFPKIIKEISPITFQKKLLNQTIQRIDRKAKLLIFVLDEDVLLSHLRMEGKYYYLKQDAEIDQDHSLIIFHLDDGHKLVYNDTRRFGTMHLQNKQSYTKTKPFINIGKEPFDEDISIDYLREAWIGKRSKIKSVLLDQQVMSGLGNIYADEVLFGAKIHPETLTNQLTDDDLKNIIINSRNILKQAIECKGTTIATYTSSLGVSGSYQKYLQVHMRKSENCLVCTTPIVKIKVSGRGTYFCPNCQIKR